MTSSKVFLRLVTLAIVCLAWQILATAANQILIPTFTETIAAVFKLVGEPEFWEAMILSNQALLLGFALSLAVGIPLGLLMGRIDTLDQAVTPYIAILLTLPMAGIIPLLIMSTGLGLASRTIVVFLFAVVMIIVNSRAGVRQVDPSLVEMCRSFGGNERQIVRRILLPGALPAVLAGVRIGIGRGMSGMVIVELLMVSTGVGYLILQYRAYFQPDLLYAAVMILVAEGLLLVALARRIERGLAPWATPRGIREGN